MSKSSYFDDLQKIPCFRKTFIFSITSGIGAGLATFIFTSRIKRSSDIGVATFAVTTLVYWVYCRRKWTKERVLSQNIHSAVHDVMLQGKKSEDPDPQA